MLFGDDMQMQLSQEEQEAHSDTLAGQSVVISGVFRHHSRDEYKALKPSILKKSPIQRRSLRRKFPTMRA